MNPKFDNVKQSENSKNMFYEIICRKKRAREDRDEESFNIKYVKHRKDNGLGYDIFFYQTLLKKWRTIEKREDSRLMILVYN